jgi:hypothetical protein
MMRKSGAPGLRALARRFVMNLSISLIVAPLAIWLFVTLWGVATGDGGDLSSDDGDGAGDGGGD